METESNSFRIYHKTDTIFSHNLHDYPIKKTLGRERREAKASFQEHSGQEGSRMQSDFKAKLRISLRILGCSRLLWTLSPFAFLFLHRPRQLFKSDDVLCQGIREEAHCSRYSLDSTQPLSCERRAGGWFQPAGDWRPEMTGSSLAPPTPEAELL